MRSAALKKVTTKNLKGFSELENIFMTNALAISVRELGNVWPNPSVGCVLAKDGEIIGLGWTQAGGRPHAEAEALQMAGEKAKGSTAYVTLEPCAHEGETPSCARLLAEAGVKRVVYAVSDPDPRTSGKGAEFLEKQGVAVETGLGEREAFRINQGFFTRIKENRPMVTLKMATSNDGMIAEGEGLRTAITGEQTNLFTHKLRAKYDAILVGIGTVLADDPSLTCRISGMEHQSPVRIVLDRTLKIPPKSALIKGAKKVPLWIVSEKTDLPRNLAKRGVELCTVKDIRDIKEVIENIVKKGITRLLVEGGATINTSFHQSGLVDYIYVLQNPALELGPDGVPAFRDSNILRGGKLQGFKSYKRDQIDEDVIDFYERTD